MSRAAIIAFVAYIGLTLAIGERFPLSRVDMYARASGRREAAVPRFLADGRDSTPEAWRDFDAALTEACMLPPGTPTSMEYLVREWARQVAARRAPAGAAPGPVRVQVAYQWLHASGGRVERGELRVVCEGTAWPR